jgi:type VI protein secretion system component Hcp
VVGDFNGVPNAPANSIQVLSLATGASCPVSSCTPSLSDVSLLKAADSASPKLFQALVTNTVYATATILFWQAPTSGTSYTKTFTIYLTQAKLDAFQISGGEGGTPSESLSLSYATIAFQDNTSGSVACYNASSKTTTNALTC